MPTGGTALLSSQGTEKLGGSAVGKDYDPATGAFAVVSISYLHLRRPAAACWSTPPRPVKGMGWYLTGTLTLPWRASGDSEADRHGEGCEKVKAQRQDRAVEEGRGHQLRSEGHPTVTWSTKKKARDAT